MGVASSIIFETRQYDTEQVPADDSLTSVRRGYLSGILASQPNDSIRVKGLLLPAPTVGEGLGMRAIELRFLYLWRGCSGYFTIETNTL